MVEQTTPISKIRLMLAGQDSQSTIYNMNPVFTHDARFQVMGVVSDWEDLQKQLSVLKPELLIINTGIAPTIQNLLEEVSRMETWQGIVMAVIPQVDWQSRGSIEKLTVVRGCFIEPVNWADVANRGFSATMTQRARITASIAGQDRSLRMGTQSHSVTGTRTVAVIPVSGGAGASTIAGNLAYELQVRFHIQCLLMGLDHPAAVVSHFGLHYRPNASEYFMRPGDGFTSALQKAQDLDVLVSPDNSIEYAKAQQLSHDKNSSQSIYSMLMDARGRNYAGLILDLPSDENGWLLQGIAAANTALLVARPIMQDITATWVKLRLMEEKLMLEHRIPRENIFLVINQVSDNSSFSAHEFCIELSNLHHWAPPVAAIISSDSNIVREQDRLSPPVLKVDDLRKGIHAIADLLFPGMVKGDIQQRQKRSLFSMLPFRLNVR